MTAGKTSPKVALVQEEFEREAETGRWVPARVPISERVRPNRQFLRLADVLGITAEEAMVALEEVLSSAETTPQGMSREQIVALAPGVLAVIETRLPERARMAARNRLCQLLAAETE